MAMIALSAVRDENKLTGAARRLLLRKGPRRDYERSLEACAPNAIIEQANLAYGSESLPVS
jgi:hypothetical protein